MGLPEVPPAGKRFLACAQQGQGGQGKGRGKAAALCSCGAGGREGMRRHCAGRRSICSTADAPMLQAILTPHSAFCTHVSARLASLTGCHQSDCPHDVHPAASVSAPPRWLPLNLHRSHRGFGAFPSAGGPEEYCRHHLPEPAGGCSRGRPLQRGEAPHLRCWLPVGGWQGLAARRRVNPLLLNCIPCTRSNINQSRKPR